MRQSDTADTGEPPGLDSPAWLSADRLLADRRAQAAYLSLMLHVVVGILAAVFFFGEPPRQRATLEIGLADAPAGETGELAVMAREQPAVRIERSEAVAVMPPSAEVSIDLVEIPHPRAAAAATATSPPQQTSTRELFSVVSSRPAGRATLAGRAPAASLYSARRGEGRAEAVRRHGGNEASEAAVARGLAWLAGHQGPDGSWRCDLANARCRGGCRNPGTVTGSVAATGIALLPFLAAGSTHLEGPYQETVSRGLYHLIGSVRPSPRGGDLCEGSMYAHGIATLVLAEAYGMTRDPMLEPVLIQTLRFIESSQDLSGGGWRYLPAQPGDITVTTWQVAALKSGAIAGLEVSSQTVEGVERFLDAVQSRGGAAYGYRTPAAKRSTSAVGLLCRLYTGWEPRHEAIRRGASELAGRTPDPHALYENFYLSQLLLQSNHPSWKRWNARVRDGLVRLQSTAGHERGSWFLADAETATGGRLAHTALAVLTLEVYYRLLPIFGEQAVDSGW